ncbi:MULTISPECIES: hypothetical protein [Streptomyces]|uniref:Ig-like domain-containing protein n=2 Tax=Streptomyces TaxID=1883 RepID=A0A2N8PPA5_STRNR|nr:MULTISPECIES: hypothetical protein [Streptomyces]PNE42842.1 hypothetical protein AOB60_20945 [Streptomyces noursei]QRX92806.1 hypothetical protein JNO44_19850 [Streptomyces noursei]UJB42525.1 hypothetical protein HRD51_18340 [Streptomyces sp. A1-5]SHL01840.1 hypothetical protein SAMN05216268_102261 [Streptomyces yunnanensis]
MEQRTRTGRPAGGTGDRVRKGIRAGIATGLAAVSLAALAGCAFGRPKINVPPPDWATASPSSSYDPYHPTPSYTPSYDTYSPSPTQETYSPDGRSDVRGSGCDFSASLRQFTYTVSITNPSTTSTFSYDMRIDWMKDKPADGSSYGEHQRSVVVAPGATETYTAKYTLNQSSWQAFWYTCQITRATKSKM